MLIISFETLAFEKNMMDIFSGVHSDSQGECKKRERKVSKYEF